MKAIATWLFVGALTAGVSGLSVRAEDAKPADGANTATTETAEDVVNQGELARMLVAKLGLARFLPANPSDQQCCAILLLNGVAPLNGWEATKAVDKGVLARVIVQAVGSSDMVENPDDPNSWIKVFEQLGFSFESPGAAVSSLEPKPTIPVATAVFTTSTDPLVRREIPIPADEDRPFLGVLPRPNIIQVLETVVTPPPPRKPKPVTPN